MNVLLGLLLLGQVINGPDTVPAGRLAKFEFSASGNVAEVIWLAWLPDTCPLSEDDVVMPFGNVLVFASPYPGPYRLIVAASVDGKLSLAKKTFRVEGTSPGPEPNPGPNPNPNPGPGPNPNPPPGPDTPVTEWRKWAAEKVVQLVPREYVRAEGDIVARAMLSVVMDIKNGQIKDTRQARELVRNRVRTSLGTIEAIERWTKFSDLLASQLDRVKDSLTTVGHYAVIWEAVAYGIRDAATHGVAGATSGSRGQEAGSRICTGPVCVIR